MTLIKVWSLTLAGLAFTGLPLLIAPLDWAHAHEPPSPIIAKAAAKIRDTKVPEAISELFGVLAKNGMLDQQTVEAEREHFGKIYESLVKIAESKTALEETPLAELGLDHLSVFRSAFTSDQKSFVAVMRELGRKYGELYEELQALNSTQGHSSAYRGQSDVHAERRAELERQIKMTFEVALAYPFLLRPGLIGDRIDTLRRSQNRSAFKMMGAYIAFLAGAMLGDHATGTHIGTALLTGSGAGLYALEFLVAPGFIRKHLVMKPAFKAVAKVHEQEREAIFNAFREGANRASPRAAAEFADASGAVDYVIKGLARMRQLGSQGRLSAEAARRSLQTRACEYVALTPEQRLRVDVSGDEPPNASTAEESEEIGVERGTPLNSRARE